MLDENGACRGICAMNLRTYGNCGRFRRDAIIICTGGNGAIFGKSTNSVVCTGSAQSCALPAGRVLREWRVYPGASDGHSRAKTSCGLMSESARGEGGRVWVPRDRNDKRVARSIPEADRYYFLEERYPKYGNLVAARHRYA